MQARQLTEMTAKCKSLEVQLYESSITVYLSMPFIFFVIFLALSLVCMLQILILFMEYNYVMQALLFFQTERDSLKLQCETLQAEFEKNNETQVRTYK